MKTNLLGSLTSFGLHPANEDHFAWVSYKFFVIIQFMKTILLGPLAKFGLHLTNADLSPELPTRKRTHLFVWRGVRSTPTGLARKKRH
jgi:hypothetical protein